jgi:hypothetical protein
MKNKVKKNLKKVSKNQLRVIKGGVKILYSQRDERGNGK